MLNKEKNASEIVEIAIEYGGIGMINGKLVPCNKTDCYECDWYVLGCRDKLKKWANSEYIEHPKLTLKERQFCELVETGWIVRDEYGYVYWFMNKPYKKENLWGAKDVKHILCINEFLPMLKFEFISWEDEEPWSVEDLLKLEVLEHD